MLYDEFPSEVGSHPAPHATVTNERVFEWWDYPIYIVLTILNITLTIYFLSYWFSPANWFSSAIPFAVMSLMLLFNLSMYHLRWLSLPFMRRPKPMPHSAGWNVGVVTTFVPGAESIEMLDETLQALVAMDYPHDTWVLDEGDDPQVKALCLRLGAHHFSRKTLPHYQTETGTFQARTKHGNYNAWLYEIGFDTYDLITAFDPDHVPHQDFLMHVLGYFDDPDVGYVQAPQVYYNQAASFIARGAAEETYAYYSSIQMISYAFGYPIVTGCHNTHRVTALKQVGGFARHEADDLLITILYRASGWRGVYTPQVLAKGLTPVDWSSYLTQQRRWARSVLDVKFRIYPKVAGRLPLWERLISFIHGLYYLHGITTAVGIALLAFMLVSRSTPVVFSYQTLPWMLVLFATFQLCDFYRQRFYLEPRREWGVHWRAAVLGFAKWPYVLLALYDALARYHGPYTITRKIRANSKRYMLVVPNFMVISLICIAWLIGMVYRYITNPMLDITSAITVIGSLGISLTEWKKFPDPYDPQLRRE